MSLIRSAGVVAACTLVVGGTSMRAAGQATGPIYTTSLSAAQAIPVPVGAPTGSGTAMVRLAPAGDQITVQLVYSGLTSNATGAHIRQGWPGDVGAIVYDLAPTGGTSGTNGASTFSVTPEQLSWLRRGYLHVDVRTVDNPSGEIRGQLHVNHSAGDVDGDGRTDLAVFRPANTRWYLRESASAAVRLPMWGLGTDIPVPGDYDGDGRLDLAVFRPAAGLWYILNSATEQLTAIPWGLAGDIPVPGDFDRDGRTDVAVFRPSTADWWILHSVGTVVFQHWGSPGDRPAVVDVDGDGAGSLSVLRPGADWWVLRPFPQDPLYVYPFGVDGTHALVPADYSGDGFVELAVFDPVTAAWRVWAGGHHAITVWGAAGDIPVPGDYDSDGKADLATFRPSSGGWFIRRSFDNSLWVASWGINGDVPVPSMYTMPSATPTAVGDTATVNENSGPTAIPVLSNDTDPDGGPKSVSAITQPANGIATITGGGTGVTYQPTPGYCNTPPGTTLGTFTYTLAQVVAFIQGQNTGGAFEPGSASASGTGSGFTGGAGCAQPTGR